jgi:hypothetical protein
VKRFTRYAVVAVAAFALASAVVAGAAVAGNGTQTYQFKTAYWEADSGVYWTCSGVHKISKTGGITDDETCTTTAPSGVAGAFVAGSYTSNAFVMPTAHPGGCGAYVPGLPGLLAPNGYTYWSSDYPAFDACALFFTLTYAPTAAGGWTDTIKASYS